MQRNLGCQESASKRSIALPWVRQDREICSLKIRVSVVQSRRSALLALSMRREKTIQAIRKHLFVALTERGGATASINAACSHRVEKVSHVEPGANVLGSMHFASWAERVTALLDNFCGKRNVARDDEVTGT
jgi:hypothetical protein